ncbi:hypothetical protein Tco_0666250 [Tanacetum coccineum]
MSENLEFSNDNYVLYDRVMYPLITQQERKNRKGYGTKRGRPSTSTFSSSAFHQPSSSHHIDDDNDGNNEGTSRASTPSPTHFVNSLSNNIPQVFSTSPNIDPNMEAFYTRQTKILNHQVQLRDEQWGGLRSIGKCTKNVLRGKKNGRTKLFVDLTHDNDDTTTPYSITKSSSPSPPNAPSKTPSTKDTSSTFGTTLSLFESKPQSSPLSSKEKLSPQPTNPFLDYILDAPPRLSNPIPLQSHHSLDITLSLSPITPIDHLFESLSPPSLSPPPQPLIMGHLINFNILGHHGQIVFVVFAILRREPYTSFGDRNGRRYAVPGSDGNSAIPPMIPLMRAQRRTNCLKQCDIRNIQSIVRQYKLSILAATDYNKSENKLGRSLLLDPKHLALFETVVLKLIRPMRMLWNDLPISSIKGEPVAGNKVISAISSLLSVTILLTCCLLDSDVMGSVFLWRYPRINTSECAGLLQAV